MTTIITFIFFILGAIIGSFLNVVILRFNTHKTLGGRSMCMSCRSHLHWYDLVPMLSFLWLGGKCRSCKVNFSAQYFWVELLTGFVFALLFIKLNTLFFFSSSIVFAFSFAFYATVFAILMIIAVYDLRHKIIPDTLSIVVGILGLLSLFLFRDNTLGLYLPNLWDILAGFVISVPFALLWFFSGGKWMGLGDAKMMVGLGWILGFAQVVSGTVIAFWIGSVTGILLLFLNKNKFKINSEIPFAPFLIVGSFIAFFFSLNLFLL